MTLEEAEKVASILVEADMGCIACVTALVDSANDVFPEFEWEVHEDEDYILTVKVARRACF